MLFPVPARDPAEYIYTRGFDRTVFQSNYAETFSKVPKYNLASLTDLLFVLGKIEQDASIMDIRWMAYMLATTFIETSHTIKVQRETVGKNHKKVVKTAKLWRNFTPIEESGHGHGLKYSLPVKVKLLPTGDVGVTEYDGDQWIVSGNTGIERPLHKHQKMGLPADAKATSVYEDDDGDEHTYYGRGYVQLTWWSNYAKTGILVGRGLELLLNPDLVMEPDLAYLIMSTGMRTGRSFANRHSFADFFHGSYTDYVRARLMVNPKSSQESKEELARIAEKFERLLFTSRIQSSSAALK